MKILPTAMLLTALATPAFAQTAPADRAPAQQQQPRTIQDDINSAEAEITRTATALGNQIAVYANQVATLQQQNAQLSATVKAQADQIASLTKERDALKAGTAKVGAVPEAAPKVEGKP